MVERPRGGKRKQQKKKLLASHQRSWLWGRNLVQETLAAARWPILELYLADELPDDQLEQAQSVAERNGVEPERVTREAIERLCHSSEHQGFLAKMGPFPYQDAGQLLDDAGTCPMYLILDSIQDPYNFGAIVRSAAVLGVNGVFIAEQRQVPVTSMVARSSAGGVNHVPISQVADLAELIHRLRDRSIQVIAASEKSDVGLTECDFRQPTAVVIGNEGEGISPDVLAKCSALAKIPLSGDLGSLNAAVAAALFCYEAWRQRAS